MSNSSQVFITVIIGTSVILALAAFIIFFLFIHQKRKFIHQQEKQLLKERYDQELLQVQLEIQEQTFQQVSREIHDNVGQILAVVKLYLASLNGNEKSELNKKRISETDNLVSQAINELRSLSYSLNSEKLRSTGLAQSLRAEVERIAGAGKVETRFSCEGEEKEFAPEHELILFRMCQELLANAIRHSRANLIEMKMKWLPDGLHLSVCDDGIGFDPENRPGNGMNHLRQRAALVGASLEIISENGKGTTTNIQWLKSNSQFLS